MDLCPPMGASDINFLFSAKSSSQMNGQRLFCFDFLMSPIFLFLLHSTACSILVEQIFAKCDQRQNAVISSAVRFGSPNLVQINPFS